MNRLDEQNPGSVGRIIIFLEKKCQVVRFSRWLVDIHPKFNFDIKNQVIWTTALGFINSEAGKTTNINVLAVQTDVTVVG